MRYISGMKTQNPKNKSFLSAVKRTGLIALIALSPSLAFADKSTTPISAEVRAISIWNQPIKYEYSVKQDQSVDYDGEAFVKDQDGRRVNVVILNKVFFKKEAQNLFRKFKHSDVDNIALSDEELILLEKKLGLGQADQLFGFSGRNDLKSAAKRLQAAFEYKAWHGIYEDSIKNNSSASKAESEFSDKFTRIRMRTIEYHEVSHLADLANAKGNLRSDFEKFTELNAFYTELAYGENPWDVMSQAMTGVVDELTQQKSVDFSIEKVASAIKVLKNGRSKGSFNNLLQLIHLNEQDYIVAGKNLHQRSYLSSR